MFFDKVFKNYNDPNYDPNVELEKKYQEKLKTIARIDRIWSAAKDAMKKQGLDP